MKALFDFVPIFLFFIAYKFYGVFVATAVAMAASFFQTLFSWIKHKKIEPMPLITFVLILLLGSATLMLHNPMFIKWKPTAIYWVFALLFTGSQWIGKKPLLQRMMGNKITLPKRVWHRLNQSWAAFFLGLGALNVYVVYHYSTDTWVNFKLFGTMGLTLGFAILQAIYMTRHMSNHKEAPST